MYAYRRIGVSSSKEEEKAEKERSVGGGERVTRQNGLGWVGMGFDVAEYED